VKKPKIQQEVEDTFVECFGRTPLAQRLQDILGEAIELSRYTDLANLKEELADLQASCYQLANEIGENSDGLVRRTLEKIKGRKTQYHTLGRKLNIALLGGAFNPITVGHIQVATFVLDTSKTFDEVWLMPCAKHMHGKKMASEKHRLAMCEIAAKTDGRIKVSDYEIKEELSGETYQLVKRLQNEDFAKSQFDFSIIIGMDNALNFDQWVNYENLERMIRFVVVPRKGYSMEQRPKVNWFLKPPHIYLAGGEDTPIDNVSSTHVRDLVDSWIDYKDLVPPGVFEYIEKHKLYVDEGKGKKGKKRKKK